MFLEDGRLVTVQRTRGGWFSLPKIRLGWNRIGASQAGIGRAERAERAANVSSRPVLFRGGGKSVCQAMRPDANRCLGPGVEPVTAAAAGFSFFANPCKCLHQAGPLLGSVARGIAAGAWS